MSEMTKQNTKFLFFIPERSVSYLKVLRKYPESSDKYMKLSIATSLEGCTHRLADVGNRVHTWNVSDEDVRGYACKQAIAWRALPWSFIMWQNNRI